MEIKFNSQLLRAMGFAGVWQNCYRPLKGDLIEQFMPIKSLFFNFTCRITYQSSEYEQDIMLSTEDQ
jgi:hypothetical protein